MNKDHYRSRWERKQKDRKTAYKKVDKKVRNRRWELRVKESQHESV